MKAMIFAAGLGTRFKPWTDEHPKALALVHGKTLLQRNIEYLQGYGIKDVVVNIHHFPDQVIAAINENEGWGSNIIISDESDSLLDTGGGLLKAKDLLGDEPFLTINVDILTDLSLNQLFNAHQNKGSLATLAVTSRSTSRYLLFDESARLCGWCNTKTGAERIVVKKAGYIQKAYSGIAMFSPEILDLIPFTGKFSLIDVYLSLAPTHPIRYFDHSGGKFIDVGKPNSVQEAQKLYER